MQIPDSPAAVQFPILMRIEKGSHSDATGPVDGPGRRGPGTSQKTCRIDSTPGMPEDWLFGIVRVQVYGYSALVSVRRRHCGIPCGLLRHAFRFGPGRKRFVMELFGALLWGPSSGGGVPHSVFVLSSVIALGIMLGRVKVAGIGLGVTGILFVGIVLGVLLGSFSFRIPGVPQPVRLGLAGGPLIVAILVGRYGPRYKLITYTTMSANLMLREVGIALFLACVGLGAGAGFVPTIVGGGYVWIAYGALITVIPLLVAGVVGRCCRLDYHLLTGVLAGASTNPPALAFASEQTATDSPSVGYATVYPLAMFLRVVAAQLLILIFA